MKIDDQNWEIIRKIFKDSGKSTIFYSIATVNDKGMPHVTPIGSLFLRIDKTGFYFEEYGSIMKRNLKGKSQVCIMAVNTGRFQLYKSLITGHSQYPVAVRIYGTAGEKREATGEEMNKFRRLIKPFKWTKGYDLLWKQLRFVRDIHFDEYEPVRLGNMKSFVDI